MLQRTSSCRLSLMLAVVATTFACGAERSAGRGPASESDAGAAAATTAAKPPPRAPAVTGAPDVAALAARLEPSVVSITSVVETSGETLDGLPFGHPPLPFFGAPDGPPRRRHGLGSGFVIDAQGHIATNAHVVEDAVRVRVRLSDDRELPARVVGRDPLLDVAVLSVDADPPLAPVTLGSSEDLRVGEYVIAAGNPLGLGHTVTMGIVSAKGRAIGIGPYDDFIQTDASINPGNSGGPLFNVRGEVVGINSVVAAGGAQGIGFAIPIDAFEHVLPELLAKGEVERAKLGVTLQQIDADLAEAFGLDRAEGALVADVESGGPAAKAGLRPGDVVVAVDGKRVEDAVELPRIVADHAPGAAVDVEVRRPGSPGTRRARVVLGELEIPGAEEPPRTPAATEGLGVVVGDAPAGAGALVLKIAPGSAAADVLRRGDVIVEVDRARVHSASDLARQMKDKKRGVAALRVRRGETTRYVPLRLD